MNRFALAACFVTLAFPATLFAEPATQAGAEELAKHFQAVLGPATSAVQVHPEGETYAVTIDLTNAVGAIQALAASGFHFGMTPLDVTLTDMGDGTWSYALHQPIVVSYSFPGEVPTSVETSFGSVKVEGVFDEALGTVRSERFEATDVVTTSVQQNPVFGEIVTTQRHATQLNVTEGKAGVDGVDLTVASTITESSGSTMLPMPDFGLVPITTDIALTTVDGEIKGLQAEDLLALWVWFLAQPSIEAITSNPPALKSKVEAILPVFGNVDLSGGLRDLSVTTPVGVFTTEEFLFQIAMAGIVADGQFHEGIEIRGFTAPEGLVPDFAKGLVPIDLSLGFTVTDFDPSGAAYVLLKVLDQPLGSPPPAGFEEALLASLLPNGAVTVTLDAGAVTGRDYKLTYEGALTAGPAQPDPTFTARLALTGMEAIRTAMQSAPPELELGTAAMGLGAMGGLAKPGAGGELVWEISLDETGAVLVNGRDVEKIFGNQ